MAGSDHSDAEPEFIENKIKTIIYNQNWRMGWDSNPRYALTHAGFQDRCLKPLGHPSGEKPYCVKRSRWQGGAGEGGEKALETKR